MPENNSFAEDMLENCNSYKDDEHKLVCIESTLDNGSLMVQGLNEDAKISWFTSQQDMKQERDELREEVGRIPKDVPEVDDVTVVDRKV